MLGATIYDPSCLSCHQANSSVAHLNRLGKTILCALGDQLLVNRTEGLSGCGNTEKSIPTRCPLLEVIEEQQNSICLTYLCNVYSIKPILFPQPGKGAKTSARNNSSGGLTQHVYLIAGFVSRPLVKLRLVVKARACVLFYGSSMTQAAFIIYL